MRDERGFRSRLTTSTHPSALSPHPSGNQPKGPPMSPSPTRVEFGISLPNRAVLFGLPVGELIETAVEAEASGLFDSVWVGDNFLSKPRLEAIALLSALAARTERVKLGTICLATFPMRHPLELAIQWASLDVISGGRTVLVVCNGGGASRE